MDPVIFTLALRGAGMLLSFFAGILALKYGYKLYRDGTGNETDAISLEFFGGKATAASVGSVVMATAVLWGVLGAYVSPSFDRTGDTVRVYSFETQGGQVTSRAIAARALTASLASDPARLKGLFLSAVKSSEARDAGAVVVVDGTPATLDQASLKTERAQHGVQVSADFRTDQQTASMIFVPQVGLGKVVFVPSRTMKTHGAEPTRSVDAQNRRK